MGEGQESLKQNGMEIASGSLSIILLVKSCTYA